MVLADRGETLPAHCLRPRPVERVWGRRRLPPGFPRGPDPDAAIGEIWYEGPEGAELLVKYLFTSERLSIQVHPGDDDARALGLPRGKDEAWYVIEAEPDAVIGIGLTHEVPREALRAAALDGGIERLLDWRPVRAGDILYSPAGTIHAIGGGIALIEIQQNLDLTYRLYDYGRPRELHLDEAIAVADPGPWIPPFIPEERGGGRTILAAGGAFVVERWRLGGPARALGDLLAIPLAPGGAVNGTSLAPGSVWAIAGDARIEGGDLLVAYPGANVRGAALELCA